MTDEELYNKAQEMGLDFTEVAAIVKDFEAKVDGYGTTAESIVNLLLKTKNIGIHSVRYRVKDPTHLHTKIIRKKVDKPEREITLVTYESEITDLAGIRVLHLFKSDWEAIHEFIMQTWHLKEEPTAYYRKGDSDAILELFEQKGCVAKMHPAGYRSVHYIIETSTTKAKRFLEIQVRTIFEEGWSEVDHKIRYPTFSDNPLTNNMLMMLNSLAGNADEMSSFVKDLNHHLAVSKDGYEQMEREKNARIQELETILQSSRISPEEKTTLERVAQSLQTRLLEYQSDRLFESWSKFMLNATEGSTTVESASAANETSQQSSTKDLKPESDTTPESGASDGTETTDNTEDTTSA